MKDRLASDLFFNSINIILMLFETEVTELLEQKQTDARAHKYRQFQVSGR